MTTFTALTTIRGAAAAYALGERIERLDPAPTALAVTEVEDGSGLWEVGAYFLAPPDETGLALLAAAHGAAAFAVSKLEDRDWVAQVRRELTPVQAGRFVVFGEHDRDAVPDHLIRLQIEAAMAFGTGHHGTTRGCLLAADWLAKQGFAPQVTADIGCGTGVLAMAAAACWRRPVVATDIDPVAVATARANVAANRLGPWVRTGKAVGFRSDLVRVHAPYDLIFANILARPLKRLAPDFANMLAPAGVAILSGVLNRQAAGVEGVFRAWGMRRLRLMVQGEWTTLVLGR
jgi:ribosomal protein L11 methyltransferase